jgi:hypothetical protein
VLQGAVGDINAGALASSKHLLSILECASTTRAGHLAITKQSSDHSAGKKSGQGVLGMFS